MVSKKTCSFKTETKKMLDIMIHSIYTHKEIFLRELISNSADALNKIRFRALTDSDLTIDEDNLQISLSIDKDNRKIIIEDNGIGMSREEVIENIGTVARSGSENFLKALKEKSDAIEIIGQFGVGFYSAFMVAKQVEIFTKTPNAEGVYWYSEGLEEYTVESHDKTEYGTKIVLYLREGEEFDEFLDNYKLQELVKKHSNYVSFPIKMDVEKYVPDESSEEEYATKAVIEEETLNSMIPLWRKPKKDIEEDDYNKFYRNTFNDFIDPIDVIHTKVEGLVAYDALLYIPSKRPVNFMQDGFKTGIQLYSKQVFIMKHVENLLPEYLNFVRGVVDSPDFSLNISREMLQKDRQIKRIGKNLEKKILSTIEKNLKENREKYEEWWHEFGIAIKNGIYQNPQDKDKLKDLLVFYSNKSKESLVSLKEYVENMGEEQEYIYYLVTRDKEKAHNLPQLQKIKDKDYEVLFFTDPVDEFMVNFLNEYDGKKLKSLSKSSAEEDDEKTKELKEENKSLLESIKENLDGKIDEIKISNKLKDSAVCLVTDDAGMSLHTEEILKRVQQMYGYSKKILEINSKHSLFSILQKEYESNGNSDLVKEYSELLYNQALIMEGLEVDNPTDFANKISKLMVNSVK